MARGEHQSPVMAWRVAHRMTLAQLAQACGLDEVSLRLIEAGKDGIPGELQDYLTGQRENVSRMASEQAMFISITGDVHPRKAR